MADGILRHEVLEGFFEFMKVATLTDLDSVALRAVDMY